MARYGGDEWLHRGRSGKVVVALGVGEGQELPGFLVGLENVRGEVAGGLDRPGVFSRQEFSGQRARADAPAELSALDVLTGTSAGGVHGWSPA